MTEWLGPGDSWTKHPRPQARTSLREAALAGWSFRKLTGHSFGMLRCGDGPGCCRVLVYSTSGPADGSETAREIRKALRSCTHHDAEIAGNIDGDDHADDEIEARVAALVRAIRALDARDEELAAGEQALDDDDLPNYEAHLDRVTTVENDAVMSIASIGIPVPPWPPAIGRSELFREAGRWIALVQDDSTRQRLEDILGRVQ